MFSPNKYKNPLTNEFSCSQGFKQVKTYGSSADDPIYYCYKHFSKTKSFEFAGLYSYASFINPVTNDLSCPDDFTTSTVYGTSNRDFPIYLCWRKAGGGLNPTYTFGGFFGEGDTENYLSNPLSEIEDKCPIGTKSFSLLGSNGTDYPLRYCMGGFGFSPSLIE